MVNKCRESKVTAIWNLVQPFGIIDEGQIDREALYLYLGNAAAMI